MDHILLPSKAKIKKKSMKDASKGGVAIKFGANDKIEARNNRKGAVSSLKPREMPVGLQASDYAAVENNYV